MQRRSAPSSRALFGLVLVAATLACAAPRPSAEPSQRPSASPGLAFPAADIAKWIRFREAYGLRADEAYVRHVAAIPASLNDTGIPLLPAELDQLGRAVTDLDVVLPVLSRYGTTIPDVFAGVVVDGAAGVLLVTDDVALHRAATAALLPEARTVVRQVRWSLAELEAGAAFVNEQAAWFPTVNARLFEANVNLTRNNVRVRYLAPSEAPEAVIREKLGNHAWLDLVHWGPLPWDGPRGALAIHVIDQQGRPVANAYCAAVPVDPSVDADSALSFSTDQDGDCLLDGLPATRYVVTITAERLDGSKITGTTAAAVPADGTGFAVVRIVR